MFIIFRLKRLQVEVVAAVEAAARSMGCMMWRGSGRDALADCRNGRKTFYSIAFLNFWANVAIFVVENITLFLPRDV